MKLKIFCHGVRPCPLSGWDMGVGQKGTWEAEAPGSPSAYRPPDPGLGSSDSLYVDRPGLREPTGPRLVVIRVDQGTRTGHRELG